MRRSLTLSTHATALRQAGLVAGWALAAAALVWAGGAHAAATAAAAPAAKAKAASDGYTTEPVPSWVQPVALDAGLISLLPRSPLYVLLHDMQTRLERNDQVLFERIVRQVNETGGLENASQIQINFDPSYQRLALHKLEIWRQGSRIDKLPTRRVQILQRESQLERQMVDGRRTASIVLDDVRVGDRVEFAYSLRGANPVFEGRFVDTEHTVSWRGPTALVRYRLLAPTGRDIRLRADPARHEVSSTEQAGWRETVVKRVNAPQFQQDNYVPASYYLPDQVQFSEFADWADVARWGARAFGVISQAPSPAVQAEAARLAQAGSDDPVERVRRTLDFVQKEVRYFGTEMGANSHRPAEPDQVLKQRFGDCKDKTTLLVSLLKAQGISATPVLVSTYLRGDVDAMLPSPLAFDHVIAKVDVAGGLLLDGTRARQTGPLPERVSRGLGWGLATDASATALTALPDSRESVHVESEDRVVFERIADDPTLIAQMTYQGDFAESLRYSLDAQPAAEVEKQFSAEVVRHYPRAELIEPMAIDEVEGHNAVRVRMKFKLPDYLRLQDGKQLVGDYGLASVMNELRLPDQAPRKTPMRLGMLGIYRHAVEFKFPEEVFSRDERTPFDHLGAAFELHTLVDGKRDSARISSELKLLRDRVEAADWVAHRDLLVKLWPRLSGTVGVSTISQKQGADLLAKIRAADESARRGATKPGTEVQQTAQLKLWMLQSQLDGGRLPRKPRAQVLVERGMQQDHLGQVGDANQSFKDALGLDADNADAHAGLSVNALLRGDDEGAITHASQALKLSPTDAGPRYTRAFAHYYAGRTDAARDELLEILKSRSEIERSYATLWLHLVTRKLGGDAAQVTKPYLPADSKPAWPYPVVKLFNGSGTLDEALAAARADKQAADGRLCELYFFLGQQQLLSGQTQAAREWFQKAVDTRVREFTEYALAQRELQAMAAR
ncbi:DUF3857 domain-containing protein [Ideonella sp. DXS29W]|uniref:DUF3857 domain-containing protein n=1 Tax=Ideonella lacteola TaxID=2984193 RepID=A0ABU9BI18_9BURK